MATNNYPEVTETVLTGGGLFDELMRAVKANLLEEYQQQRIRGADYAKVYLGSMEAVLANAVQYLASTALNDAQRDKIYADIELTKTQQKVAEEEIKRLQLLTPLEGEKLEADILRIGLESKRLDLLTPLEAEKLGKDIQLAETENWRIRTLTVLEEEKLRFQIDKLFPLEEQKLGLERDQLELQKERLEYEKDYLWPLEKDRLSFEVKKLEAELPLIRAQASKILQELKMIPYQVELAKIQVEKTRVEMGVMKLQRSLTGQQIHKTRQERFLIEARYATEQANWSDGIFTDHFFDFAHEYHHQTDDQGNVVLDANGNPVPMRDEDGNILYKLNSFGQRIRVKDANGNDIAIPWLPQGLIRRQKDLLKQQRDGFIRDAEQKAAKIFVDTFQVQKVADEDAYTPSGLQAGNISRIVRDLARGVGVDVAVDESKDGLSDAHNKPT